MKRLILLSCWVLAGLAGSGWAQENRGENEGKPRAAVVNIQELFKQYYKTRRTHDEINLARARIQKEHNDTKGRLRSLTEGLRQLEARLQREQLGSRARAALEREMGLRLQEWEGLDQQRREAVKARHGELNQKMVVRMEKLLEEIREIVAKKAEQSGYDLVFDVDGLNTSQVPVLLFARDATDITSMILEELNKGAPRGE